jgi:cytochrome c-type biogenesis protein CcmF
MVKLGEYSLYLTIPFALYAIGAAVAGTRSLRGRDWARSSERAVYAVFALLCLAVVGLEWALLTDRFDLSFVYSISSREQPVPFKLAIWGGHDGSLLLWGWMLGLMSALVVFQNRARNRVLMPWVIVSQMVNLLFFSAVMTFSKNPFAEVTGTVLSNGAGMNPILQHPVMLIHPPILYVGFVGFSVPFAFAVAALITGELGTTWFRSTRRWTLTAWFFLGTGLLLGGRWAYEVLGWGGYWAWDPVENSSLMPWLAGTAFLHSVMIQEKRGMLKIWNIALIGLTYLLCLFGTFLTRSGIVQSVHSFANAGLFGVVFLGYLIASATVFIGLLVNRLPDLRSQNRLKSVLSREGSFLLNNYVFLGLLAIVLWGTMYPVISEAIWNAQIQLGPPSFQRLAGPLAIFLLLLTGIGPLIAWRRTNWTNIRKSFVWPATAGSVTGLALFLGGMDRFYPWAFLSLCAFVTGTIVQEYARGIAARMRRGEGLLRAFFELLKRNQRRYGGYVVHLAVMLMFVGFAGAAFDLEETRLMRPGERWELANYTIEYRQARPIEHSHYAGAVARLALWRDGEPVAMLLPEKRVYFQQQQPTTLPAVLSSPSEDFYVIMTGLEPDQSAAFKVYINPLVNWLWIGGFVFVLGNTLLLWRLPAPTRTDPV